MTARLGALAAAVLMTLTALAGCGVSRACTEIGAESGVTFAYVDSLPAAATEVDARACVDDLCVDSRSGSIDLRYVFVRLPDVTSERTVTARLTLRSAGAVIFEASTPVNLRKVQPNGEGCPPVAYNGRAVAFANGNLVDVPYQD